MGKETRAKGFVKHILQNIVVLCRQMPKKALDKSEHMCYNESTEK